MANVIKKEHIKMHQKDHNFNQSCEHKLNGDIDELDVDNIYEADDSFNVECRGHMKKRSAKKKNILILCAACVILLLILACVITYAITRSVIENKSRDCIQNEVSTDTDGENKNDCLTEKCKVIAEKLKKSMNFSADPCEDFYEYSCGKWDQAHPLPDSMEKLDTLELLKVQKNTNLKNIIESESSKAYEPNSFKRKIFNFYKSCNNLELIDKQGKAPLLKFISKFGEWSAIKYLKKSTESVPDISSLLILSHQYFTLSVYSDQRTYSPLFKTIVKTDDYNSSRHNLELGYPDLPISYEQTIQGREKYEILQKNYVTLLGPSADAEEKLVQLINFEIELEKILQPFKNNTIYEFKSITVKEFAEYVGHEIDWIRVLKGFFSPLNIKISNKTNIGVVMIDYFKALNDFIANYPKQLINDYIIWVCVWKFGSYASKPFREADFNFLQAVSGIREEPERWKKCIAELEQTMDFGLASLYVQKALTAEDKILATEIVANITTEFRKNLMNVEWMDMITKAKALEKVDAIVDNIGYPDFVKNETYMNIIYENVQIDPDHYFENVLAMYKYKRDSTYVLLNEPVDRTRYDLPPTLVEAYYDRNKHKMVFLAGIMHVPIYDTEAPMALNYGALGLVAGHEITHAFDNIGKEYDKNGEKRNWWTNKSSAAFSRRAACMVEQYSNYSLYGINLNGERTLNENIADNGGTKVVHMTYKKWEKENGEEKTLPGITLTMEQLLFVSHGQVWCGAYREEYIKTKALKIDFHSPSKYRIIGPLSNLAAFSDAFKCPPGSAMNPVKKCQVW